MSHPLLAAGRVAATPYVIPRLFLRIWSVEELCYLWKTNPFILDQTVLDRKLVSWLDKGCELPDLARSLSALMRKNPTVEAFVMTVLDYSGYLTGDEVAKIAEVLAGGSGLGDYERDLRRADYLLRDGKYYLARREYERILAALPDDERLVSGRVLHNLGVALAKLFSFTAAADCFLAAYGRGGVPASARAYLAALRLTMGEMEYVDFIAGHPTFHDYSLEVEHIYNQAVSDYNDVGQKTVDDDGIARRIDALKEEYRRHIRVGAGAMRLNEEQ